MKHDIVSGLRQSEEGTTLTNETGFIFRPGLIFALIAASIFLAEALVMGFIGQLPQQIQELKGLIDAFALTLILLPLLYLLFYRPIISHIEGRHKAEEQLVRLAVSVEQIAEAIVITDTDMIVEYANPASSNITGKNRNQIVGHHFLSIYHPSSTEQMSNAFGTLRTDGTWRGRGNVEGREGHNIECEISLSAVYGVDKKIENYVGVISDISTEARLEEQLRHARKMESIGTLAGGIAHDFNNILSGIIGYSELALDDLGSQEKEVKESLEQVLSAGNRAKDLIRQIMTFSRRSPQKKVSFDITPVVAESLKLLRATLSSNIELTDCIGNEVCNVLADATQISQVVMNLCSNAAHAMSPVGGKLTVRLEQVEIGFEDLCHYENITAGPHILLSISDTGSGIEKSIVDKIFDPFFTTKKAGEGTGLGLSVVHGIISDHGGAIDVVNHADVGTEFRVYLPCHHAIEEIAAVQSVGNIEGKERVLVIDDEILLANLARRGLGAYGYAVTVITDPEKAIAVIYESLDDFDIVITDNDMPRISGVEISRAVHEKRAGMPVIMMSGYGPEVSEKKLLSAGISRLLVKPVSMSEVARNIREVLDQRPS